MTGTPRLSVADYRRQMGLPPVEPAPRISSSPATPRDFLPPAAAHLTAGHQGAAADQVKACRADGVCEAKQPQGGQISLSTGERIPGRVTFATIVIPGIPAAKGRPRLGKGRTYTPEKTAAWEQAAKASARAQWGTEPPLEGAVFAQVVVVLPIPESWSRRQKQAALDGEDLATGRPDLDNYIKAAFDALNEIAWRDDAQVVEVHASKAYGERPRVEIRVSAA